MTIVRLCACGCGEPPNEGKRFKRGHYSRTPAAKRMYKRIRKTGPDPNPSGVCQCGCGKRIPKADRSRASRGIFKGNHPRYAQGHNPHRSGCDSHKWKGGRRINGYGYIEIHKPEHPQHNGNGYVLEHRLIMEKKLGRFLDPEKRVHHINGIRTDNRVKNLVVLTRSEHAKIHFDDLAEWRRNNMKAAMAGSSKGGKKGAAARWERKK